MKKWYLPLVVLGAGGMGALLLSEGGRKVLDRIVKAMSDEEGPLAQWSASAEQEVESIQKAIDGIAEMLGARGATAR